MKFKLSFYGQYSAKINDTELTAGFRGVSLDIEGIHYARLPQNSMLLAYPINSEITGFRSDMPSEMIERCHSFRLARRIGALLCHL